MGNQKQIECKKVDCQRKGFWVEVSSEGEHLYCHKVWHDGNQHTIKKTLAEIKSDIKDVE